MSPRLSTNAACVFALFALVACADPTHDDLVASLGDDKEPNGPLHRRGQPCLACHGGSGPGSPRFAVAGTVYAVKGQPDPLVGCAVTLTDANGSTVHSTTNASGNFMVGEGDWSPVYPVHVRLSYKGLDVAMGTHIGRDGSCASCHAEPAGPASPGHVYLVADPADLPQGGGK